MENKTSISFNNQLAKMYVHDNVFHHIKSGISRFGHTSFVGQSPQRIEW